MDSWALGMEASTVIGLRTLKLAAGGAAAQREAELMVDEKVRAAAALQFKAMTGGLGVTPDVATRKVLAHYRRKVRANRHRLVKG